MHIPRQAQVLLSFIEQVIRAVRYDDHSSEWESNLPRFNYKKASDLSPEFGLWLDLYCQLSPKFKPQQVAGLEFKSGVLSHIICEKNKCFANDEFFDGLQLMVGLVDLAKRSVCAADVSFYDFSYKVTSIRGQRVAGILLGPNVPATGARSIRKYDRIAEVVVDQQKGQLLSFKSLYKPKG